MPRLVRFDAQGPIKIDPNLAPGSPAPSPTVMPWPRDEQGNLKPVFVCACGLSTKFPFCDGTHKACKAEAPDRLYEYDPATKSAVRDHPLA